MILSDIAIKKPVFAWMIMLSLLLFGGISFLRLGVSQNPDVDSPVVNVRLAWEGAAPEVMENTVIDPIARRVVPGVSTRGSAGGGRRDFIRTGAGEGVREPHAVVRSEGSGSVIEVPIDRGRCVDRTVL